jgi:hypothetical protein
MTSLVHVRLSNRIEQTHHFRKSLPHTNSVRHHATVPTRPATRHRGSARFSSRRIATPSSKLRGTLSYPHRVVESRQHLHRGGIEMLP